MNVQQFEQKIGDAWQAHRSGQQAQAVQLFETILSELDSLVDKDSKTSRTRLEVDARYGLGLALRAQGNQQAAISSLQAAYSLCQESHQTFANHPDFQAQGNDRGTYEDDRYMMLLVMLGQRLRELGASVPS